MPGMMGAEVIDLATACAQPISSMITTVESDQPDIKENFPGHIIDRDVFDRNLVQQAERQGAVTQFGITVRATADDGTVTLSDGRDVRTRVIIGADGPRSLVGQRISHYEIKRVMATGGMGAVYEAEQEQPHRTVALKVMRHGIASPSALRRFEY